MENNNPVCKRKSIRVRNEIGLSDMDWWVQTTDDIKIDIPNVSRQSSKQEIVKQDIVQDFSFISLNDDKCVRKFPSLERAGTPKFEPKHDRNHLFECLLLVGLNLDHEGRKKPYTKMKFPNNIQVHELIKYMCFPDAHCWEKNVVKSSRDKFFNDECYIVYLTEKDGRRKNAYCRRLKPEGESHSLPLIYCILSYHKANDFYFKVLREIECRHGESDIEFKKFIYDLYISDLPTNGRGITVGAGPFASSERELVEQIHIRPLDPREEDLELAKTLLYLKFDMFSLIFSDLLLERKVILFSNDISKLSMCIEGLQIALLPFEWQHTLITAVPTTVISIVDLRDAPTPYLIGLLKSKSCSSRNLYHVHKNSEILIVDLDEKKVLRKVGDENSVLPNNLKKDLRNAIQLARSSSDICTCNILVREGFMKFFTEIFGLYRRYIVHNIDEGCMKKSFQKNEFVKAAPNHQIRMFLDWFVETAAFDAFINVQSGLRGKFH